MTVIKRMLAEKKMSTHKFHQAVGGNRSTLFAVVGGYRRGTAPLRARVAAVLGVDEGDIFNEVGMARMADQD